MQYNTIQYNTIQYNTIQYNTIQYNTTQHNTILHYSSELLQYIYSTNHKSIDSSDQKTMTSIPYLKNKNK